MRASKATGEWCPPTKELKSSQLSRLISETRRRDDAAVQLEVVRDEPTRKVPDGSQAMPPAPLEDMLFSESVLAPMTEEFAVPVSLESESRYRVDPPARASQSVLPAIAGATRRLDTEPIDPRRDLGVIRLLVWLCIVSGLGVSAYVWFAM